jgi:hypothetical protein
MNKSDSIKNLAIALSKAQGELQHAKKDVNNDFFRSKYADLASCIDAAKKPLADNGLSVSQIMDITENGELVLETILMHVSGEFLSGKYPIKPMKPDPQSLGSCVSYARRYCFSAITGIAADDDDGNSASGNATLPAHKQAPKPRQTPDVYGTPNPPVDYFALIEDSKTLSDLAAVWKQMPAPMKPAFIKIKDAQKKVITDAINGPGDVQNYPSIEKTA